MPAFCTVGCWLTAMRSCIVCGDSIAAVETCGGTIAARANKLDKISSFLRIMLFSLLL